MMHAPEENTLHEYADAAAVMQRSGLSQSPAEAHGFALGLVFARVPGALAVWRREWYSSFDPADVLAGECRALLDRVFASVLAGDRDTSMQFTLLLPSDIVVDSSRLSAVRDWCQGFLFGLGLGGEAVTTRLSMESRSLLNDFAEITRLDTGDADNSPENQSALIEIEEYVRVGVMLIGDDLGEGAE